MVIVPLSPLPALLFIVPGLPWGRGRQGTVPPLINVRDQMMLGKRMFAFWGGWAEDATSCNCSRGLPV